jgi:23S rRNA (guanosine2251-2'-O)-methyltransferase
MREQKPGKSSKRTSPGKTSAKRERSPGFKKDDKPVRYVDKRVSRKDGTGSRFSKKSDEAEVPLHLNSRGEPARPKPVGKAFPGSRFKRPDKKESPAAAPRRFKAEKESGSSEPRPRNFIRESAGPRKITYGKNIREIPAGRSKGEEQQLSNEKTESEESENNYIYGRHPVLEALKTEAAFNKVWIGEYTRDTSEIVEFLKEKGIPYKIVPRTKLNDLVGENTNHQGVVAEISGKEYTDFEELIELCKVKSPFFIILDKVEDPHNLGAIIRTADAAGVDAIIIPKHKAVGLTGVVAKTAAGSLQRMKVSRVANLGQSMDLLKKNNVWTVGVDMEGKENYSKANFKGAIALVLGGEGQGLSRLLKEKCDFIVRIPMQSAANSLNVSVATAILVYEVFRQKDFK